MVHSTIKFIFCFFMVLLSFSGFAQLGFSENKIIESQGKYFKKNINETSILLHYNRTLIDDYGKSSPEIILYIIDKKTNKCFLEVYNCSKNAINTYYKTLNSIAVQIDEHTWKNYNNNSIYILKVDGNILNIEHSYMSLNSSSPTDTNSSVLFLQNNLNKYKNENQNLSIQINSLKERIKSLTSTSNDLALLTNKGAENLEKSLESLKDKDFKITRLQNALVKKDSLVLKIIDEKNLKIKQLQNELTKKDSLLLEYGKINNRKSKQK